MPRSSNTAILDATLRLIAKGGIDAVRYRDVARESGIALGTISYQYPSREELLRSTYKHFLATSETSLRKYAADSPLREPRDVAKLISDILAAEFSAPGRAYLAEFEMLIYAARDPEMATMLAEWDRRLAAELGCVLESVGVQSPFATAETLLELSRGFQLVRLGQKKPDFDALRLRIERVLNGPTGTQSEPAPSTPKARRPRTRR